MLASALASLDFDSDAVLIAVPIAYARFVAGDADRPIHCVVLPLVVLRFFFVDGGGSFNGLAAALCAMLCSLASGRAFGSRMPLVAIAAAAASAAAARGAWTAVLTGLLGAVLAGLVLGAKAFWLRPSMAQLAALAGVCTAAPRLAHSVLPLEEFGMAHRALVQFGGAEDVERRLARLVLTTVHAQVALGYVGISYLRSAQRRKNLLLRVGRADGDGPAAARVPARSFARQVGVFILHVALPYMLCRTAIDSINRRAFDNFAAATEDSLRLDAVLRVRNGLAAAAAGEASVEGHAFLLSTSTTNAYKLIERKLFSLPKLAMLPALVLRNPAAMAFGLPLALLVDAGKGRLVAELTERIEEARRQRKKLKAVRSRVEAHDTQHAWLLRGARAEGFALGRWTELTHGIQALDRHVSLLQGVRDWINWMYWQDILHPGVEIGIAWLLERDLVGVAEIWLYARAFEDGIDTLLMRSRAEAELSRITADTARLAELAEALRQVDEAPRLACGSPADAADAAHLSLSYTRGEANVTLAGLVLPSPGIWAVAGRNGGGKSTLFDLIGSCAHSPPRVPAGVHLSSFERLDLPAGEIVELTQRSYCPLHARPIDWIASGLTRDPSERPGPEESAELASRVAVLAEQLRLGVAADAASCEAMLLAEADDFCATLSGGQRVKFELMRSIFLRERCPAVLLLDETFAALDPGSKATVMRRIQQWCTSSLVLAIFHSDRDGDHEGGPPPFAEQGAPDEAREEGGVTARPAEAEGGGQAAALCEVGGTVPFFSGVLAFGGDGRVSLAHCEHGRRAP